MTHVRRQIRELAVTTITGLTTTGSNVFPSRFHPLQQANLPAWYVSTSENEESENVTGTTQQRAVELVFEGIGRAADGDALQDLLDGMAEELETVMTFEAMDSLCKDLRLQSTEWSFDDGEADQAFGSIVVTYLATYHTAEGAPGTAI